MATLRHRRGAARRPHAVANGPACRRVALACWSCIRARAPARALRWMSVSAPSSSSRRRRPVSWSARPGTGKTTTLVDRVASLVAGGMSPDAIVVLTPSRQSATLLRDRLALAVDRATSGPLARSVASLAFQLVRAAEVHAASRAAAAAHRGRRRPDHPGSARRRCRRRSGGCGARLAAVPRRADPRDVRLPHRGARLPRRVHDARDRSPAARANSAHSTSWSAWQAMASFFAEYLEVRARMRGAHRDAAGLVLEAGRILRADRAGCCGARGVRGRRALCSSTMPRS